MQDLDFFLGFLVFFLDFFLKTYWFVFVSFGLFQFIFNSLIMDFIYLSHFFNKNQIKVSDYYATLDFITTISKKLMF